MKNFNLTVKELRLSLKEKIEPKLYNKLGIDKMKKEDLLSLYSVTCNTTVSTDITSKENNKKQRSKQKAVKNNTIDLDKFIVFHTKDNKSLVKFDYNAISFIPQNLRLHLKLSFKELFKKGDLKYIEQNKITHEGYYLFSSEYNKVVKEWRDSKINYKKEEKLY